MGLGVDRPCARDGYRTDIPCAEVEAIMRENQRPVGLTGHGSGVRTLRAKCIAGYRELRPTERAKWTSARATWRGKPNGALTGTRSRMKRV